MWQGHVDKISAEVATVNTGKFEVLPHAVITGELDVHELRTQAQEDELFDHSNFGGNPSFPMMAYGNYWDRSDPPIRMVLKGNIPFESPNQWIRDSERFKNGELKIYVVTRAYVSDRLGAVISESCCYFDPRDLSKKYQCFGHNGPGKWPRNSP
jgi:hypothetical protein